MEKNDRLIKTPLRSYVGDGKEPFSERIKSLMRGRTIKQCADDWGIKLSTLKNYFSRPDAKPRFEVLSKISKSEKVSIEWLIGESDSKESARDFPPPTHGNPKARQTRLFEMLELLGEEEIEALTKQLTLKGVETVLYLLDEDNIKLLQLDRVMKEKVLGLQPQTPKEAARADDKARECGPDNSEQAASDSLASVKRQAS